MPFLLFLVLRLFSGSPYYLLGGDQCTFLVLGRTFPRHQLYNHDLYLIHPPLFGYVIGLFALFLPLLVSGLAATMLFASVNFFVLRNLARFDNISPPAVFVGLMYIALNRAAVAYDYHVARVSILVCGLSLALLAFLRLLREPSRRALLTAVAGNTFCLLTGDQALLLLPCQAVIFFARGPWRQWRSTAVLLTASVAVALSWPALRLAQFWTHDHLPVGIAGTIEFTQSFPLLALLQPNLLPFTDMHRSLFTQTSFSLTNLQPALLVALPIDLLIFPRELSVGLVIALVAAALTRSGHRQRALQWLVVSLLFLLPAGLGMNEWYGMGFIVPFTLLMAEGAAALFGWAGSVFPKVTRILMLVLATTCVLLIVLWLTAKPLASYDLLMPRGGTHFLFTRPPVTRAARVSRFFTAMPADVGIMAPVDLVPEIVYLTDKRVLALPFDPDLLDRFIDEYRISYLLVSSESMLRYESPKADRYTSALVTRYLFAHPQRYRLLGGIREPYAAFYPPLDYYVFQINR